jgi:uncharacterized protein YraI
VCKLRRRLEFSDIETPRMPRLNRAGERGKFRDQEQQMNTMRLALGAAFLALCASQAFAAPAYVTSTVNLRSAAGTTNEIVAKIPGGSLVDATNCNDGWCEVDWQGKKGFAIQTVLDMSGRVPVRRAAAPPRSYAAGAVVDDYVPIAPPPVVYYGGYRPYWGYGYRPYRYGWGYRYGYRGYRRW